MVFLSFVPKWCAKLIRVSRGNDRCELTKTGTTLLNQCINVIDVDVVDDALHHAFYCAQRVSVCFVSS